MRFLLGIGGVLFAALSGGIALSQSSGSDDSIRVMPDVVLLPPHDCDFGPSCAVKNHACMVTPNSSCEPNKPTCDLRGPNFNFLDWDGNGCGCCWP
jgi:hypothetical protein